MEYFVCENHYKSSYQSFLDSRESGNPGGPKFDYITVFGLKAVYLKCFVLFRGAKLEFVTLLEFKIAVLLDVLDQSAIGEDVFHRRRQGWKRVSLFLGQIKDLPC